MGQGALHLNATFPWDTNQKSTVKGTLRGLDFTRLNQVLEPQVNARAESGTLNELNFEFAYNDNRSDGVLEMNYSDLRMVTFRNDEQIAKISKRKNKHKKKGDPEDDDRIQKAPLKTFVLNAFIIRKNKDGSDEQIRNGTIGFPRDKHRSIFNYWAKSLFSGVKSAYNIDKLEDSRLKRILDKKNKD
jgi:hypothetical protein